MVKKDRRTHVLPPLTSQCPSTANYHTPRSFKLERTCLSNDLDKVLYILILPFLECLLSLFEWMKFYVVAMLLEAELIQGQLAL